MKGFVKSTSLLVLLALVSACSSGNISAKEYSEPREKIAAAEQANKDGQVPNKDAALHLRLAKENLDKADVLIKDGDKTEAKYYLMMASADAEVARSLAEGDVLKSEVNALEERINKLQNSAIN